MRCLARQRSSDTPGRTVSIFQKEETLAFFQLHPVIGRFKLLLFNREDLTRAKTSSLTALAERETEIKKLREQINFRTKLSGHRREEEVR